MANCDSGAAFPKLQGLDASLNQYGQIDYTALSSSGMSLRDYFAGQAMQGWLASFGESQRHPAEAGLADSFALAAYALADAMLKAREPHK